MVWAGHADLTALVSPELSHLGTLRPSAVYRQLRYVLIVARYKRRFFASCSCLEIKGNFTNTLVFYTSVSFVLLPIYFSTPTFCLCVSLSFFVVHFSFPIFHFRFFSSFFGKVCAALAGFQGDLGVQYMGCGAVGNLSNSNTQVR